MLHEITERQLAKLVINHRQPLVICDVDEVIVHFTRDFEDYLAERNMVLETTDLRNLQTAIRSTVGGSLIGNLETMDLVDSFFAERTRTMKPIDKAVDGLQQLSRHADVVMLTNLPHSAGDHRRENLAALGLPFPVITNSGPKGPAINIMASKVNAPIVFIDDSPSFIASAHEHAPHVRLVHFVQDPNVTRATRSFDFVWLYTHDWDEIVSKTLPVLKGGD
jgi:FMN phosphatase YigB (HAD superfamily)